MNYTYISNTEPIYQPLHTFQIGTQLIKDLFAWGLVSV